MLSIIGSVFNCFLMIYSMPFFTVSASANPHSIDLSKGFLDSDINNSSDLDASYVLDFSANELEALRGAMLSQSGQQAIRSGRDAKKSGSALAGKAFGDIYVQIQAALTKSDPKPFLPNKNQISSLIDLLDGDYSSETLPVGVLKQVKRKLELFCRNQLQLHRYGNFFPGVEIPKSMLELFTKIKHVGQGSFGSVSLCYWNTNQQYGLPSVASSFCTSNKTYSVKQENDDAVFVVSVDRLFVLKEEVVAGCNSQKGFEEKNTSFALAKFTVDDIKILVETLILHQNNFDTYQKPFTKALAEYLSQEGVDYTRIAFVASAYRTLKEIIANFCRDNLPPLVLATSVFCTQEALTAGQSSHPCKVGYLFNEAHEDLKKQVTTYYTYMEYVDGKDLRSMIKENKKKRQLFSQDFILRIFTQICLGLHHMHTKESSIHRDLKPSNLMVGKENVLKLIDFGMAIKLQDKPEANPVDFLGTPHYVAPEIIRNGLFCANGGQKAYDQKVDCWSLGVILYELITLERPFEGGSVSEIYSEISNCNANAIWALIQDAVGKSSIEFFDQYEVSQIIYKLLQPEPEKRVNVGEILKNTLLKREVEALIDLYQSEFDQTGNATDEAHLLVLKEHHESLYGTSPSNDLAPVSLISRACSSLNDDDDRDADDINLNRRVPAVSNVSSNKFMDQLVAVTRNAAAKNACSARDAAAGFFGVRSDSGMIDEESFELNSNAKKSECSRSHPRI